MDAARLQRVRRLLQQYDAGEVEASAVVERYGLTVSEARGAVAARETIRRTIGRNEPKPEWGRVKGIYMVPEVEALLVAAGKRHGGQGRALAAAIRTAERVEAVGPVEAILAMVVTLGARAAQGHQRVTVDPRSWQVGQDERPDAPQTQPGGSQVKRTSQPKTTKEPKRTLCGRFGDGAQARREAWDDAARLGQVPLLAAV